MTKQRIEPRLSVNKLAQYVTSRALRQNQILRTAKFPPEYITTYYREAGDAIMRHLASGMTDHSRLEKTINSLNQQQASNIYEARRISGNIDAIETYETMLDRIEFNGASPKLGSQTAPHLTIRNVGVSVRPEITLHKKTKTADLVGGIKLHFPKTEPLDEEQANFISAMMQVYCETHMPHAGTTSATHCMVIDMASANVYPAPKSIKQRMKEVESSCQQIVSIWPTITP